MKRFVIAGVALFVIAGCTPAQVNQFLQIPAGVENPPLPPAQPTCPTPFRTYNTVTGMCDPIANYPTCPTPDRVFNEYTLMCDLP